jgi:hypothetical protein
MRKLRQLSMVVVLMLMLGTYALAGIIDTPPDPALPPAPVPPSATATGIMDTSPSGEQLGAPATDPIMDIALNLLQGALSLF